MSQIPNVPTEKTDHFLVTTDNEVVRIKTHEEGVQIIKQLNDPEKEFIRWKEAAINKICIKGVFSSKQYFSLFFPKKYMPPVSKQELTSEGEKPYQPMTPEEAADDAIASAFPETKEQLKQTT